MATTKTLEARWLRKNATFAERLLWECLRGRRLGVKFRRQQPIAGYILDFYCFETRLAVEADGEPHFRLSEERLRYEQMRDFVLKDMGITILRFENADIVSDPQRVVWKIENVLRAQLHLIRDQRK